MHPYPIFEPNIIDYFNGAFWSVIIGWLLFKLAKKYLP